MAYIKYKELTKYYNFSKELDLKELSIYSLLFLYSMCSPGKPIILFIIAERLRNLGRYTFADVVSYRLSPKPVRTLSAIGSLVVVRRSLKRMRQT